MFHHIPGFIGQLNLYLHSYLRDKYLITAGLNRNLSFKVPLYKLQMI